MTIKLHLLARCLLWALSLSGAVAFGAVPSVTDEAAFTAHVAERIKAEIPGAEVKVTGVRTIIVKINGRGLTASLDNLVADCAREPSECESLVDNFVEVALAASRADEAPVQKGDIRVVVRNAEYVEQLTAPSLQDPKRAPIVQQLVGDLWLVCVIDQPQNTVSLSQERAANGIGVLDSDFYESSRWLLHDEWEPLSKRYNGNLVVAIPTPNMVIYGDGSSPEKQAAIATLVKHAAEKAPRRLSTKMFRWTKAGWDLVK